MSERVEEEWPGDRADAVIRQAVKDNARLFERFREFGHEDLFQEAQIACRRAWPKFNPQKSAFSTFLTLVTRRRLIDLCRGRSRRAERELAVAAKEWAEGEGPAALAQVNEWVEAGDGAGLPGGAGGDAETLEDWLGGVYRQAVHAFKGRRGKRGRNWFTPAQVVAVVLLMRKRGLSTRGAKLLLEQNPDLCAAVKLRHVPHHMWFSRAGKFATDNLKIPRANNSR